MDNFEKIKQELDLIVFPSIYYEIFSHQDFFFNLVQFMDQKTISNFLLSSIGFWKNLDYCPKYYLEKRKLWIYLESCFIEWSNKLKNYIEINAKPYYNSVFCIYSIDYWDGPTFGFGLWKNQFCYFSNRQEIVRKPYRLNPQNFYDFRNYNILEEGEYSNYLDYYFDIKLLDGKKIKLAYMYLFIMSLGWEHHFNNLLVNYKQFNCDSYEKHTKIREHYKNKFNQFINQLGIKKSDFITKKIIY